ncbi:MAG: response regulator [Eubacteriales bacterium]
MYKMILVDDEYLVREGIKQTIPWESYGIQIVAVAKNGEEGLEAIRAHKPDVIISDVRMPKVDGLQLVNQLVEENYDGMIVMLSGYNDFEYVRSTLQRGAYKYLLKPIDNDELIKTVLDAIEKLKKKRRTESMLSDMRIGLPAIKTKLVDDIFHGEFEGNFEEKLKLYDLPVIKSGVIIYCKVDFSVCNVSDEEAREALALVEKQILSVLENYNTIYSRSDKRVAFATDFTDVAVLERRLTMMFREYEEKSKVIMSIGISKPFYSTSEIPSSFGAAKFVACNKLFASLNSVTASKQENEEEKAYKKHIVDALGYVSEHFSQNDLSISEVSEYLGVSDSYLMHLFKKELGKTFNTCLTEYRIMMSKRLLTEEKYRVYEIAEMVGYVDMKYFSQVFKKIENCTPSEYIRKRNEKKS